VSNVTFELVGGNNLTKLLLRFSLLLSMIQLNILELAKQGDTNAINTLVSQWLNLLRITPKTSFKQHCLQIMLESIEVPIQELVVPVICDGLINSSINYFNSAKIQHISGK
jgi:hypothetical protein